MEAYALTLAICGAMAAVLPWCNRESVRVRRFLFWLFLAVQIRYLWWRAFTTLPAFWLHWQALVAYLYFGFELWASSLSLRQLKDWSAPRSRTPDADRDEGWHLQGTPPLIDILIPTYNEKREILECALFCATAQQYPRYRVWLLDDGRRPWVKELAETCGARYLTRPTNEGFKAGNLNHALAHILANEQRPDFLGIIDCDFVAKPSFLSRTVALMRERSVGIVQTTQIYYNPDLFQYAMNSGRALPDWMRFNFDFSMPMRDAVDKASCCGTSFLIRFDALALLGKFPSDTVAEDALLSMALESVGYKTVFLNEAHSYGIVAEGLREFLTQCGRWCLGTVQNIWTRYGPMSMPWPASLLSIEKCMSWGLFSAMTIVQFWTPALFWLYGPDLLLFQVPAQGFPDYFFPVWGVYIGSVTWAASARQVPIVSDARALLSSWVVTLATWRGLKRSTDHRFEVTAKGDLHDGALIHWGVLKWILLLFLLTGFGMLYRVFFSPIQTFGGLAYFWSLYNLCALVVCILVCVERPRRRLQERFDCDESALVQRAGSVVAARLLDVSISGAKVASGGELDDVRDGEVTTLELEDVGCVPARVVRRGSGFIAFALETNLEQRRSLTLKVFSTRYVRPVLEGSILGTYAAIVRRVFS